MEDTREHFNRALLGAHADMQKLFEPSMLGALGDSLTLSP
jgi:hypothetical protein